jgi:hypothetical protein
MSSIETSPTDRASLTVSDIWTLGVVLAAAVGFTRRYLTSRW